MKKVMKKGIWIFTILFLIIFFTNGIGNISMESNKKIMAPRNKLIPIKGSFKVETYKSALSSEAKSEKWDEYIGKVLGINEKTATFGDEMCISPSFKVKNVDTKDYFLHFYKIDAAEIGIKNSNVNVVSVTCDDKLFYDFIKIDDDHLVVFSDNAFFFLSRVSDKVKNIKISEDTSKKEVSDSSMNASQFDLTSSGVLIGMKTIVDDKPYYRTIWIAYKNKVLHPVLETQNLFVPRKSGFWMIESNRVQKNDFMQDVLEAYPIESNSKINTNNKKINVTTNNVYRNILFVGNDYIATEYGEAREKENVSINKLQVLPIDNIESGKSVKIFEVAGGAGRNALLSSAQSCILAQDETSLEGLQKNPNEENFTLVRKNGHWIMKGRLNYINTVTEDAFIDFNINIIPTSKMVNYDSLSVSWNDVKGKVPEALDVFTSPNKELALIVSKSYIYVYKLKDGAILDKPIQEVKINKGESIIMTEWATGDYVERWEKSFSPKAIVVTE